MADGRGPLRAAAGAGGAFVFSALALLLRACGQGMALAVAQTRVAHLIVWWLLLITALVLAVILLIACGIALAREARELGIKRSLCVAAALAAVFIHGNPAKFLALCLVIYLLCFALERAIQRRIDEPEDERVRFAGGQRGQFISMRLNDDDAVLVTEPPKPKRMFELRLLKTSCGGIAKTSLVVAGGLLPLTVVALIMARASTASAGTVRTIEYAVVRLQVNLQQFTGFRETAFLLVAAALLALVRPRWKPVSRAAGAAQWVGRVAVAVTVVSSYSFFTTVSSAELARGWALVHREEMFRDIADLDSWTRLTAAASLSDTRIRTLPAADQKQVMQTLHTYSVQGRPDLARSYGAEIGESSHLYEEPALYWGNKQRENAAPELDQSIRSIVKIRGYLAHPDSAALPDEQDEKNCDSEATEMQLAYSQGREALIELLLALGDQMHLGVSDSVEPFVRSLTSSVANSVLDRFLPENVPALLRSPRQWRPLERLAMVREGYAWTGEVHALPQDGEGPSADNSAASAGPNSGPKTEEELIASNRNNAEASWERAPEVAAGVGIWSGLKTFLIPETISPPSELEERKGYENEGGEREIESRPEPEPMGEP